MSTNVFVIRTLADDTLTPVEVVGNGFAWPQPKAFSAELPKHGDVFFGGDDGDDIKYQVYEVEDLNPTGTGPTVTYGASVYADDAVTRTVTLSDPRTVNQALEQRETAIIALRDSKRYPGNVATGLGWDIDFRNSLDKDNIQASYAEALALKIDASGDTVPFMGADNVLRNLTPDQMIAAGNAVKNYGSSIYAIAWGHKAAIGAIASGGGSAATKKANIDAYDITAGW